MRSDAASSRPPSDQEVLSWVIAGVVALVALIGVVAVLVALMLVLSFPAWVEIPVAFGLAGGACVYAWAVAKSMSRSRRTGDPRRTGWARQEGSRFQTR